MTEYVPFPHVPVKMPESGKVTGKFVLVVRGSTALVLTEGAHVNDENEALYFRGERYLAHLELVRSEDGTVSFAEETGWRSPTEAFTRGWGDNAPPSYARTMAEAIRVASEEAWTDVVAALGEFSSAAQALSSVERDLSEVEEKVAEVRQAHAVALARYEAASMAEAEV